MSSKAIQLNQPQTGPHAVRSTASKGSAVGNRPGQKMVYLVDPLTDPRWDEFVQLHPRACLFHSSGWLRALAVTYGYRPIAYTTCSADEPLLHAAVVCEIDSWLTGRRLVALPFSDHCEWLVDRKEDTLAISTILENSIKRQRWRYLELRTLSPTRIPVELARAQVRYTFHLLDLRPDLETIFANFHKSSIQRKIKRADRDGLVYSEGTSDLLLNNFYRLLRITRERHRLPPQPKKWFANLIKHFGDGVKIRMASKDGIPAAAMLTVRFKDTMVYKYGCSDLRFNRFGSMHLLFWNAIQEAKRADLKAFDFGRTDADQQGLINFKGRWGGVESVLDYSRYSVGQTSGHVFDMSTGKLKARAAKYIVSHLPSSVVSRIGEALYRHVG
jgi:Acetyltransferase (GNAT) domain